ncbi:UDP-glucose dehydrogenase family protein [Aurantiacibacter spongiae]|uniref:UDP-glucose 6-dehydrogenase n=1 Tax=Aurantiacibacter spongiae TaxID=2488860 RepID=A0A3N5DHM3_9SPHN|nr:UDP-glucose/GDP-mannose dehydrogenase family protein [Aurantiacibacter spongiae]RPF71162.1 UDP-glucose/GDP-mannose dehydrogenase family protein [Aurantiacibacter spongiae]
MNIVMIGAGYVGLVSGACFAEIGHTVTCIDTDEGKIATLRQGGIPIFEPGLDALAARGVAAGRLSFATDLAAHVPLADVVFIAVGTPARRGDGHADLTFVGEAAREIARHVSGFTVIVTKSTVPVGTGDWVERLVAQERPDADIAVASNPEFLREGAAIDDFLRPDRIVAGSDDARARAVIEDVYRPITDRGAPLLFTGRRTSELVKYAANAFLALKITYINEVASLCEKVEADVRDVAYGIGLDHRIGADFLSAGPGYGGSCFPKDTLALMKTAQDHDSPMRLVEMCVSVNDARKRAMARKVMALFGGSIHGMTVAVLGLTFKADTDDMRDSPAIAIVQALGDAGAKVRAYDPQGMAEARRLIPDIAYADTAYDAVRGAAACVIVTDWAEFRRLDLKVLARLMSGPGLIDLRNIFDDEEVAAAGLVRVGTGMPQPLPLDRHRQAAE